MPRALLVVPYGFQNQGVRLLAAVLRKEGTEALPVYFKRWMNNRISWPSEADFRQLERLAAEYAPDVIGLGFGSPYFRLAVEMTRRIRRAVSAHVVWGGVHPTLVPENCIEHADSVCVGEGEMPLADLTRAVAGGGGIRSIPNLWVRTGGEIAANPLRPLIPDLDALPYAQIFDGPSAVIENGRLRRSEPLEDARILRVFASRGCPFRCAYCYNNVYRGLYEGLGRYHRIRSVPSVIEEIQAARRKLPGIRRIRFDDDSFVFPKSWIEEFARSYAREIGIPFDILLNPTAWEVEALKALRDAGLCHIQAGIQTGSQKEREEDFRRRDSGDDFLRLAETTRTLGIEATYDIILDNPLAMENDKKETLSLLLRLPRPFNLFLYSLTHFPKTEITEKLLAARLITAADVEDRAEKSFRQFRLSLGYPRPPEETFYASLISLTSKQFVPRGLIRRLGRSRRLRAHPAPLRVIAQTANLLKLAGVGFRMLRRGELSAFNLKEYVSWRDILIQ